ncbi:hypothetical protein B0H19DRAFT_1081511 [Mycena capillaripes]|nr:hypothetical protein B0H19DRAFT_1081511 [Mycena capillaripes]
MSTACGIDGALTKSEMTRWSAGSMEDVVARLAIGTLNLRTKDGLLRRRWSNAPGKLMREQWDMQAETSAIERRRICRVGRSSVSSALGVCCLMMICEGEDNTEDYVLYPITGAFVDTDVVECSTRSSTGGVQVVKEELGPSLFPPTFETNDAHGGRHFRRLIESLSSALDGEKRSWLRGRHLREQNMVAVSHCRTCERRSGGNKLLLESVLAPLGPALRFELWLAVDESRPRSVSWWAHGPAGRVVMRVESYVVRARSPLLCVGRRGPEAVGTPPKVQRRPCGFSQLTLA